MKIIRLSALLGFLTLVPPLRALDSEGRLVAVGFTETDGQNLLDTLFSASRYTTSGQIDTSWATGGLATIDFLRHGIAMDAVFNTDSNADPNGVLAVGTAINPVHGKPQAIAVQFTGQGTLDTGFGSGGIVWLQHPNAGPAKRSIATGIVAGGNSDFAICGTVITDNNRYQAFYAEMDTTGTISLDTVIGPEDVKINAISVGPSLNQLLVGKRIINGTPRPFVMDSSGTPTFTGEISGELLDIHFTPPININGDLPFAVGRHANKGLLIKLLSSGAIDTSFGSNGYVIAEIGNKQTSFNALKTDLQACSTPILVCGTARSLESRMFVAAYDYDGNLITSFGNNGIVTILEGPNVQTIASDIVLPVPNNCTGAGTGAFAVGSAQSPNTIAGPSNITNQTPLIAKLQSNSGTLFSEYGDKGIASLATEQNTEMTVLKETVAPPVASSPATRLFDLQEGNIFKVNLTGGGIFTLQPGRYYVNAQAPAFDILTHKLILRNITVSGIEGTGDSIWNGSGILSKALLKTQLFVSESNEFALEHVFAGSGAAASFGEPVGFSGLQNIFAQMNIEQL